MLEINPVSKSSLSTRAVDTGFYEHEIFLGELKDFSNPEFLGFDNDSDMKKFLDLPLTSPKANPIRSPADASSPRSFFSWR